MKTKSLIKLRISFLLKLNTDDLNQQIHYNKYLQKVILRTTEHLFSLNTSKSLLRETITRILKTSHALSKHQNIIYAIQVAYSCQNSQFHITDFMDFDKLIIKRN